MEEEGSRALANQRAASVPPAEKLRARFKVIYLKSFMGGTDRVLFGLISVETKT